MKGLGQGVGGEQRRVVRERRLTNVSFRGRRDDDAWCVTFWGAAGPAVRSSDRGYGTRHRKDSQRGDKSESTLSTERSLHSVRGTATMKIACAPGATAARGAFSAMAVRRRAPASSVLRLLAVPRSTPAAGMNQPLQA